MNSESMCCICNQWVNDNEIFCPFCETEAPTWRFGKIQDKKKSTLLCPSCSFQNDLSNEICVACDSHLFEEKQNNKKCDICGLCIYQKLFNEHSTNCFLSHQEVQKYHKEIKSMKEIEDYENTLKQCQYCKIIFPSQLMEDHYSCCEKKPVYRPPKPPIYSKPIKALHRPGLKPLVKSETVQKQFIDQPLVQFQFNASELLSPVESARLTILQKNAVLHMQNQSNKRHNKALKAVQTKANKLGYKKEDIQNLQFYIENYAPIIIQVHVTKHMEFFIKDTHYRSQFQTNKSSGSLSRTSRTQWEDRMFDKKYSSAKDFERVKYGVINFTNDPKGVTCAAGYGLSYMLLKEHMRNRCTMTDMDSSSANCQIGTPKYCFHVLEKVSDKQLISAFNAAKALEESSSVTTTYKQIQVHGPIQFAKDIERLYVNKKQIQDKKFLDMVYAFNEQFGVQLQFF